MTATANRRLRRRGAGAMLSGQREPALGAVPIGTREAHVLIDCDVHISPGTALDLVDYTDSATRELLLHSGHNGFALPGYPWYHPTGWVRKDAFDPQSDDSSLHSIDL